MELNRNRLTQTKTTPKSFFFFLILLSFCSSLMSSAGPDNRCCSSVKAGHTNLQIVKRHPLGKSPPPKTLKMLVPAGKSQSVEIMRLMTDNASRASWQPIANCAIWKLQANGRRVAQPNAAEVIVGDHEDQELRTLARRELGGPGSSPPRCTSMCGKCTPCTAVHVPVPPGTPVTAEYYPEAWRCKCGNKLYMP